MMKMSKWSKVVIMTKFKKVEKKYLFLLLFVSGTTLGKGAMRRNQRRGRKRKEEETRRF